jgi:hypothetical protein
VGVSYKVVFTRHVLQRALERGTDRAEVEDVLATGVPAPARSGRLGKAKVFAYQQVRHGTEFRQKRVEVYNVQEGDALSVVTVYVFYGAWETT